MCFGGLDLGLLGFSLYILEYFSPWAFYRSFSEGFYCMPTGSALTKLFNVDVQAKVSLGFLWFRFVWCLVAI